MPATKKLTMPEKRGTARSAQCRAQATNRDKTGKFANTNNRQREITPDPYEQQVVYWLTDTATSQPITLCAQHPKDDVTRFSLALLNKYMQLGTVGIPEDRLPTLLSFGKWVYAQSNVAVRQTMLSYNVSDAQLDNFKAILAAYALLKQLRAF
jgi:hypothetical protein